MTRRLPSIVALGRAVRVALHGARGLATTLVVFPFATDASRRDAIRTWSRRLLELLHVDVVAHGTIERGNLLAVANHVSWLDIFVLNAGERCRFVAKAELAQWPFVGRLIRGAGTIFVTRERRHDTKRVNRAAADALSGGDIVAVFPEGTTTDGRNVMPFHASLFQPIVDSGGAVLPIALRYRDTDGELSQAAFYGDETFVQSLWQLCSERRTTVDVIVCEPIAALGAHRRDLARRAESAIRTALGASAVATAPARHVDPAIAAQ
ncbi:MAG TPA: lysophospholipid acyltransferase family protein [Casimicrobiaceae bacterium]|nr:lysophospholipid acyltransferase family protein [Casimicrobiaceae bacterium]